MPPGGRIDQAPASRPPAVGANHVGRGARLVQEHEAVRVHVALPHAPAPPLASDIGPVLLGCPQRLFLCDKPSRRSLLQMVEICPASIPRSARADLISASVIPGLAVVSSRRSPS
jgi:hypothetical protein